MNLLLIENIFRRLLLEGKREDLALKYLDGDQETVDFLSDSLPDSKISPKISSVCFRRKQKRRCCEDNSIISQQYQEDKTKRYSFLRIV